MCKWTKKTCRGKATTEQQARNARKHESSRDLEDFARANTLSILTLGRKRLSQGDSDTVQFARRSAKIRGEGQKPQGEEFQGTSAEGV